MRATIRITLAGLALYSTLTLCHGVASAAPLAPRTLNPFIQPIAPRPGSVVAASARAVIIAHVEANVPIARVELRLDGVKLAPEVMGPDDADQSVIYQPRHLSPGRHTVQVTVWDSASGVARVAWSFFVRGAHTPCHAR